MPVSAGLNFWEASKRLSGLFARLSQETTTPMLSHTIATTTQPVMTTSSPKFQWPKVNISTFSLDVVEGGSAVLTPDHISWRVAHMGHNISDHNILLLMRKKMDHGRIVKAISCDENILGIEEFTLNDVAARSLLYCHDGSDTVYDYVNFTMVWDLKLTSQEQRNAIIKNVLANETQFLSTGVVLHRDENHTFTISIAPVDDPPKLTIPLDYVFRPIKNVPTHFSNSVLNATDPDSSRSDIVYSVLAETENDEFWIENEDFPGRSISDFTQSDLDGQKITFTFRSDRDNARLILRLYNNPALDDRYRPQEHKSFVLRIAAQHLNISGMYDLLSTSLCRMDIMRVPPQIEHSSLVEAVVTLYSCCGPVV